MPTALETLASSLLVPTILFFALGLIAAFARSDLSIPEGAAKFMSLYLLLAIGFKGGASLAEHGLSPDLFATILAGVALSFLLPFLAFALLKVLTRLDPLNAAAVAGHYGSISIVTFVTATSLLELTGVVYDGYMVAVAAAMEVPAILSALWLAHSTGSNGERPEGFWRELLANGSVVLLLGAFAIGAITGGKGMELIAPFIVTPFTGILCLFLLDMGLSAGRSLIKNREMLSPGLFVFGAAMPVIGALLAYGAGWVVGLGSGSLFLLMVLAASASYIAVPAAMKIALPKAESGIYLTLSLGVTFPFNITVGLPLYYWLAS
ncbi:MULTISPECIES: sodium-dependent bicarbonate transport family permease [unclassified Leisingera]|uniref:sodium-dependent bicarbonate transport family permease n=1 Tax=unclassified Leisingera TaxID=2614906 RepID=UPI0002ECBC9A|nr:MULTISPECIES: sodium-dependent bicarbonate transport family permease [unclassified Leisingera]KIC26468.1 membrane protein [Leisingera sp. ANG-S3]KIC33469.1 membrane protein [Leisingera sp. ANG-S5]KIC52787.1 membrane protein [Leisingera sp. ANG-S]KID10184.1 membrane protein [Leisingera sp. ANG1]